MPACRSVSAARARVWVVAELASADLLDVGWARGLCHLGVVGVYRVVGGTWVTHLGCRTRMSRGIDVRTGIAMATAVVGAGPVGLVCALALAERGEQVTLIDPDQGPGPDGSWRRKGVMQFLHPHFFRHHVRQLLEQHAPAMWESVVAAGAVVNPPLEGMPPFMTTVACRRSTFEAALRSAAVHERLTVVAGRAERVVADHGRVTGIVVDGSTLAVDRVVAAHGRSGNLGEEFRPPTEGGSCGQSYVSRMYRARPGVAPLTSWIPLGAQYDGYQAIAFPQDAGTLSALVVRPSADPALEQLWDNAAYDAAVTAIPNLAPWTDPERFEPITDVMRGGTLTNTFRGQGSPPVGLFFVGDSVCTTNPAAGRGITLGLRQLGALLDLLANHDDADTSVGFDRWCENEIKPWYDDHVRDDGYLVDRYAGIDLDAEAPVPSDVIVDAFVQLPHLAPVVQPYLAMLAPPGVLRSVEDEVRTLLRTGWRPPYSDGPDAAGLVERIGAVTGSGTRDR